MLQPNAPASSTGEESARRHRNRRSSAPNWYSLVLVTILTGAPAMAQGGTGTVRVTPTGTDSGGCGSANDPCRTVQRAITNATTGETIKLAVGTYSSTTNCLGNTVVGCVFNEHITIEGGYSGGNWDTPSTDPALTVLDGQNANRVLIAQDSTLSGPSLASLTLEALTVTRGFAEGEASGDDNAITAFGGGINATNCPIFLTNVVISANRILGGGSVSSQPNDHGGAGAGGGIALLGTDKTASLTSVLQTVSFVNNIAEGGSRSGGGTVRGGYGQGGGLFTFDAPLDGFGLTFTGNTAVGGDAASASGSDGIGQEADAQGAAAVFQVGSTILLDGVVATGNQGTGGQARSTSGGLGGGSFGGAFFVELATATFRNVHLEDNTSLGGAAHTGGFGAGGALGAASSTVTVERSVVVDNLAKGGDGTVAGTTGGGAAYLAGNTIDFSNSVFADNVAELGAGSLVGGGGGAFFLQGSSGTVAHATLAGNSLGSTSLQGQGAVLLGGADVDFDFTVFSDHTVAGDATLHVQASNTATLQQGIFANNSQNTTGAGTINGLGTMLSFSSVDYASPGSPDFDYHLSATSPAIDEATGSSETVDLDNETRSTPDIGADEFSSLIFTDGFESGNVSSWSSSLP